MEPFAPLATNWAPSPLSQEQNVSVIKPKPAGSPSPAVSTSTPDRRPSQVAQAAPQTRQSGGWLKQSTPSPGKPAAPPSFYEPDDFKLPASTTKPTQETDVQARSRQAEIFKLMDKGMDYPTAYQKVYGAPYQAPPPPVCE